MIIAFDIDGTLVNDDKRVSDLTRNVLYKLKDLGHILVPTTGRNYNGLPEVLKDTDLCPYTITLNGTNVIDAKTQDVIDNHYFEYNDFIKLYKQLSNFDIDIDFVADGIFYSDRYSVEHIEEYHASPFIINYIKNNRTIIDDLEGFIINNHPRVNRINLLFKNLGDRDYLLNNKEKYHANISTSLPTNLEINPYGISKKTGLDYFKNKYNLNNNEIIFFGDALNDLEALSSEYETVVMKNGYHELFKLTKYITEEDNNHDGLAKFLIHYFNLNI